MGTYENSEDPDETQQKDLHCLQFLDKANFSDRNALFFENCICDPSINRIDHPDRAVSNFME